MNRITLEQRWDLLEIYLFIANVRETDFIVDMPRRTRARTVCISENMEPMPENPSTSTCHRSEELKISPTSLRQILRKDLSMTPYRVPLVQELKLRWMDQRETARLC